MLTFPHTTFSLGSSNPLAELCNLPSVLQTPLFRTFQGLSPSAYQFLSLLLLPNLLLFLLEQGTPNKPQPFKHFLQLPNFFRSHPYPFSHPMPQSHTHFFPLPLSSSKSPNPPFRLHIPFLVPLLHLQTSRISIPFRTPPTPIFRSFCTPNNPLPFRAPVQASRKLISSWPTNSRLPRFSSHPQPSSEPSSPL